MVAISTKVWFYVWDSRTDKGAAICPHSAQLDEMEPGSRYFVEYRNCLWGCGKNIIHQKTPPCTSGTKKSVSSGCVRDKLEYARPQLSGVNFARIWLCFSFFMVGQPRGAAMVTVSVCVALRFFPFFSTRVKAVLCWIWAAFTLKAMGRMCGKRQHFCGKVERNRTCFVMKLGTTTENEGKQQKYYRFWASSTPR